LETIGPDEILEPGLGLVVVEEVTKAVWAVRMEEGVSSEEVVANGEDNEAVEDDGLAVNRGEGEGLRR